MSVFYIEILSYLDILQVYIYITKLIKINMEQKDYQIFSVSLSKSRWSHLVWIQQGEDSHYFLSSLRGDRNMVGKVRILNPNISPGQGSIYEGNLVLECMRIYTERYFLINCMGNVFRKDINNLWEISTQSLWNRATMDNSPIVTSLIVEEFLSLPWEQMMPKSPLLEESKLVFC